MKSVTNQDPRQLGQAFWNLIFRSEREERQPPLAMLFRALPGCTGRGASSWILMPCLHTAVWAPDSYLLLLHGNGWWSKTMCVNCFSHRLLVHRSSKVLSMEDRNPCMVYKDKSHFKDGRLQGKITHLVIKFSYYTSILTRFCC